ncbi:MAG: hypothetical protein JSR67_08090 [Proteobacteria bacterium]|nr:hypothetical protein [Pseudomonadota bacterium]
MKRTKAPDAASRPQVIAAANEDFAGTGGASRPRTAGWDAYEVWRTRVKASSRHLPIEKKEDRDLMR